MPRLLKLIIVLVCLLGSPIAHANAGIPMLALAWPVQWLALIPIVLLESEIARRALGVPFVRLIWPVGKANLLSTLVGIPLAWAAMLVPELIVAFGMSLVPNTTKIPDYVSYALFPFMAAWVGDSAWQIFFAFAILTVPFCAISIYIEEKVLRRALTDQVLPVIHALTIRANIFSYVLLALLALLYPLLVHHAK